MVNTIYSKNNIERLLALELKYMKGNFIGDVNRGKGISSEGDVLYKRNGKGKIFTNDYNYVGDFNNYSFHGKRRIEM